MANVLKVFLKTVRVGMLNGAILLTVQPSVASAAVIQLPTIAIRIVTPNMNNPVTLQYSTNLWVWQPLGTCSGSINLSFTNLPAVFIRGFCTNLTASATLAWQPSPDLTVVGYRVYYGVASRTYTQMVDVGLSTTATISNLVNGTTYYFVVTAYASSGVQSPYSNEVSGAFQSSFSLTIGNP